MFGFVSSLLHLKTTPEPAQLPTEKVPRLEDMRGRGGKRKRRQEGESEFTSYYGRPVVKKPHWVWPIWFYFWVGGITAGSSAIAAMAEVFGDNDKDQSIIRAGRYISLAGLVLSPIFLIIDLQRPERFHHMLRVLKLRSPLSLGTYILTSTGLLGGINAARQVVEDGLIPAGSLPGKLALGLSSPTTRVLQGMDGLALGGYTGTLLSATAVPLWADMNELISPLFISSSFSTGAAAISLARALSGTSNEELHRLDRIEQIAITSEISLITLASLRIKPQNRRHLYTDLHGKAFMGAIGLGMIGPFLLQLAAPKQGSSVRPLNVLSSVMVLIGGFMLRYSIVEAGKASADDADAYHAITR